MVPVDVSSLHHSQNIQQQQFFSHRHPHNHRRRRLRLRPEEQTEEEEKDDDDDYDTGDDPTNNGDAAARPFFFLRNISLTISSMVVPESYTLVL